jgi:hypothetical protein
MCALSRRRGAKSGEIQCTRECTRPIHVVDLLGKSLNYNDKMLSVAPMMDWTESPYFSEIQDDACAICVH